MYIKQRPSLKASEKGIKLIKQARTRKGWIIEDERWLKQASKILDPEQNWDAIWNAQPTGVFPVYAANVSLATWRRFLQAKLRIDASTFKAFCQILKLNWEDVVEDDVVDYSRDLSEAPELSSFYGRTQELIELQQWLIQERCRLVVIHGVGGIGKAALTRQLIENIANQYDRIIWRSLNSTPPFQPILAELVQFLSNGQENGGNISQLMQYLRQHRCLLVLDDWEEIMGSHSEDYSDYCELLRRVARVAHQSSILLLSRERPQNIESLEGQWVRFTRLGALKNEDAIEILKAEGLSGNEDELDELSRRYSNPWILKRIAKMLHTVFEGEISGVVGEISILIDDVITTFLDKQFQQLSQREKKVIYWIAIRRNSASWHQIVQDSSEFLSYNQLFYTLNYLIQGHSLVNKNLEEIPILYTLDLVILKYITNRFVEDNYQQIIQIIQSQIVQGSELFISHSFMTEIPQDDLLRQEQIRRIVKPIQENLYAQLGDKGRVEEELKRILSLLEYQGLSQGYAGQNILSLLS